MITEAVDVITLGSLSGTEDSATIRPPLDAHGVQLASSSSIKLAVQIRLARGHSLWGWER